MAQWLDRDGGQRKKVRLAVMQVKMRSKIRRPMPEKRFQGALMR